jgi:hypothetical protein
MSPSPPSGIRPSGVDRSTIWGSICDNWPSRSLLAHAGLLRQLAQQIAAEHVAQRVG